MFETVKYLFRKFNRSSYIDYSLKRKTFSLFLEKPSLNLLSESDDEDEGDDGDGIQNDI